MLIDIRNRIIYNVSLIYCATTASWSVLFNVIWNLDVIFHCFQTQMGIFLNVSILCGWFYWGMTYEHVTRNIMHDSSKLEYIGIYIGFVFILLYLHHERTCNVDNLLLTANQRSVKLADFGLAREETVTEMMTAETGTYRWMAPEVFFFNIFVNEAKIYICMSILLISKMYHFLLHCHME